MTAVATMASGVPKFLIDARTAPRIAAVLAFVAFVSVRLVAVGPPGGDEPHYLLVAQSLLKDGDIKVANNYERQDYLELLAGDPAPALLTSGCQRRAVPGHAPGLPALIAPAFAIGGYWGTVAWIGLLGALGSMFVWQAGYIVTRDVGSAWFGWSAVVLTAPALFHGTLIYPDPVAGVMLAGGVLALVSVREQWRAAPSASEAKETRIERQRLWRLVCSGVPVAVLPWLHTRLALPAAFLGLVLLVRIGAAIRSASSDVARGSRVPDANRPQPRRLVRVFPQRLRHLQSIGAELGPRSARRRQHPNRLVGSVCRSGVWAHHERARPYSVGGGCVVSLHPRSSSRH